MDNSNIKKVITILVGFLLVSACGQQMPTEPRSATSTPTSQTSTPPPTLQPSATSAPPTEDSFVLPGGRLLFEAEVRNAENYIAGFSEYFWLQLPDMTVQPHQYLTGKYPIREKAVTLSPDFSHLGFAQETYTQSGDNLYAGVSVSVFLSNPDNNDAVQIGQSFNADAIADERWKGSAISWSANGQVLAFARSTNWTSFEQEHQLYVYDVLSGNLKTIPIQVPQPYSFA